MSKSSMYGKPGRSPWVYLFAVAVYHEETTATFRVAGLGPEAAAEVLGEGRTIRVANGRFADTFRGYGVHLYRIR